MSIHKVSKFNDYHMVNESKNPKKDIISELCTAMILLNNEFLDHILDRGLKARYTENSEVFLNDLKSLVMSKNRLVMGRFEKGVCVQDNEYSKMTDLFKVNFDIEKDWQLLVNSRNAARTLIDKLLFDEKLNSDRIRKIYWIGPNKDDKHPEDIVIELNEGVQYSVNLNRSLTKSKAASFNRLLEELIGSDTEKLYKENYLPHWNKLVQEWVKIIYENANSITKRHIEKFIDPNRLDTLNYHDLFDIRHGDPRFRHLGEYMKTFDKNILFFSDLLNEIWKKRDTCFEKPEEVRKKWIETKKVLLYSKILENLLTSSYKSNFPNAIKKTTTNYKIASGSVKMRMFKIMMSKMGALERDMHYVNVSGMDFFMIPARSFFRSYYDKINILFDYHVNFDDERFLEDDSFKLNMKILLEKTKLVDYEISVKFSGGELSNKLYAKHKFDLSSNFINIINDKKNELKNS